jgi:hypothetical protein
VVIDLNSRKVVGWSMGQHLNGPLTANRGHQRVLIASERASHAKSTQRRRAG